MPWLVPKLLNVQKDSGFNVILTQFMCKKQDIKDEKMCFSPKIPSMSMEAVKPDCGTIQYHSLGIK